MKFKFDPNQKHQLDAISAIKDLFIGQEPHSYKTFSEAKGKVGELPELSVLAGGYAGGYYGNKLIFKNTTDRKKIREEINKNLKAVQKRNQILSQESVKSKGLNFSVEMETGTGKTYVYLRTLFELHSQYGFKKFIIVVPSVAVREGVLKSLTIMKDHFNELFNKMPFSQFVYQSKKPSLLKTFARGNDLQMMIINIDAFNKDSNIIRQKRDHIGGAKPIDFIKATNPIVIIDEPQNMESEKSRLAIEQLNPLCTLRYSATHRDLYNPVYCLNPVQAFQKKLVKKISVTSIIEEQDPVQAYLKVLKITNRNNNFSCTIQFFKNTKEGRKLIKKVCKQHDDLFIHSNENSTYKNGFKIIEINCKPGREFIKFSNGLRFFEGEEQGSFKEEVLKISIKETIKAHFEKELQLRGQGIKVLSLLFLDRVENYRKYKNGTACLGPYGKWFEEIYKEISKEYEKILDIVRAEDIHNGYFSKDKKGIYKDTKGSTKEDEDTYSLIMKDKEKLLDINNPLKFIFSHSALREGWDNPNIFQICTLNQTGSSIKKRQEIGRGLRLPVNQKGERIKDYLINNLTVVANESYSTWTESLQKEFKEDCKVVFGNLPMEVFRGMTFERQGKEQSITAEDSKEIWNHLKKTNCLSENGFITKQFNQMVLDDSFSVPNKFKTITNDIIQTIEQYQLESHIKKSGPKKRVNLNKKTLLDPEFKKFWEAISQKTIYSVNYDSKDLIKKAGHAIKESPPIKPLQVVTQEVDIKIQSKGISAHVTKTADYSPLPKRTKVPDILSYIEEKIPITKRTIFNILKQSERLEDFVINPQQFMDLAVQKIEEVLNALIIEGIQYEKRLDKISYEMSQFEAEAHKMEFAEDKIIPTTKSVYDYIYYESGVEKRFAEALDNMKNIKYFIKLPNWFKVPTPVGTYNPDWAILKQNGKIVYMIRETKFTLKELGLRGLEKAKIKCGERHFASIGIDYKACSSFKDADL